MTYVTARRPPLLQNRITVEETIQVVRHAEDAAKSRARALIIPREHGAWGLLMVPLFTGIAAGSGSAQQLLPQLLFVAAAFALFWLRTPVESLLASGTMTARTPRERRTAVIAAGLLAFAAAASLTVLMWRGRNQTLLWIGVIAALALVVQMALRKLGRKLRMFSQLVGAAALTATAPAAYYLGTGRLDSRGLVLWLANWLFAWNQIHFVQLRIHAARAGSFQEKLFRGKFFFLAQIVLLVALILITAQHRASPLIILAFLPILIRGTRWFFTAQEPLDVKKLGWSEMKQGVAFGILLAIAFIVR
jgi:hypothetical protein